MSLHALVGGMASVRPAAVGGVSEGLPGVVPTDYPARIAAWRRARRRNRIALVVSGLGLLPMLWDQLYGSQLLSGWCLLVSPWGWAVGAGLLAVCWLYWLKAVYLELL